MPTRVEIHGLRELRRDLKTIDAKLPRELNGRLKKELEPVRRDAASRAPRRSGRLGKSVKVFTRGSRVGLRSTLPYAKTIHDGGRHPVFGNREVWVIQQARPFIDQAVKPRIREIEQSISDVVEDLMHDAGFH